MNTPTASVDPLPFLPDLFKTLPNWVAWKLVTNDGKQTKVPFIAGTSRHASATDSSTWVDYATASQNATLTASHGLGFVIHGAAVEAQLVGFDLDGCRNPGTGALTEWADRIIKCLDSYTEITPSRTGVRVWVIGRLPEGTRVFNLNPNCGFGDKVKIEVFDRARYFTMTGDLLDTFTYEVEVRELAEIYNLCHEIKAQYGMSRLSPEKSENGTSIAGTPVQIKNAGTTITKKLHLLMTGTITSRSPFVVTDENGASVEYPSHSEADQALANLLATQDNDAEKIDEQFRLSPLYREKWERQDYRDSTISKAVKSAEARQNSPAPAEPESVPAIQSVAPVVSNGFSDDMSDAVLDSRLGEICQHRLTDSGRFPIAYAWPALVSAAGTMVPVVPPTPGVITAVDPMTNFITALVGPVHSGKSQAINWANGVIGLHRDIYTEIRAGSSEGLLKKLNGMRRKGKLLNSVLIDLDEWKHLFDKAGIDHSSFTTFLQTAFYKRRQNVVVGGGLEIEFDCALTLIGGIVQDEFEECFGAKSMGGLHDRFTFGLCPEGYNFLYRPFEGQPEVTNPIAVTINQDVWEMVDGLGKADSSIGREAEIAVRFAHVAASFDGRSVLTAKGCETSVQAFITEQVRIRDILKPNEGLTNDAVCANALLRWLERNGTNLEIIPERKVQHGLRRMLSKLGPGILEYATKNLVRQGFIWYGDLPGAKPHAGRTPKAYQLLKTF